jgi:hypothetical protein
MSAATPSLTAHGAQLFMHYLGTPLTTTWDIIRDDCVRSFNVEDFKSCVWNSALATVPALTAAIAACFVAHFASKLWPPRNRTYGEQAHPIRDGYIKPVFSLLVKSASFCAGAAASIFVVSQLPALNPFSADKMAKLMAMTIVPLAVTYQIPGILGASAQGAAAFAFTCALGSVPGYFGQRSLIVLGTLSAYICALNATNIVLHLFKQH